MNPFRILVGLALLTPAAARGEDGTRVTITCTHPLLVANRPLHAAREAPAVPEAAGVPDIHAFPRWFFLDRPGAFDADGRFTGVFPEGRYRFSVAYRDGGTVVALTTGEVTVRGTEASFELKASEPAPVGLSVAGRKCALRQVLVRIPGYEDMSRRKFWDIEDMVAVPAKTHMILVSGSATDGPGPLRVVLPPDQALPVRLVGTADDGPAPAHVVLWRTMKSSDLPYAAAGIRMNAIRFQWNGDAATSAAVRDAFFTLHLPELDELPIPLSPSPVLWTNRRLLETSGRYTVGEELYSFDRRSRRVDGPTTIRWGGPLQAKAYGLYGYSWDEPHVWAFIWGAYVHTDQNDVLHTFVLPRYRPWKTPQVPSLAPTPLSRVGWGVTLRREGGEVPPNVADGTETWRLTRRDKDGMPKEEALRSVFRVQVRWKEYGQERREEVAFSPMATWSTGRVSLQAPAEWTGRARAYLYKSERIMDYCAAAARVPPDRVTVKWTNLGWQGYTIGPREDKRIDMGIYNLEGVQDLYSVVGLYVHEMLHAFGHPHGPAHDRWIKAIEDVFMQYRQALADRPEYLPPEVFVQPSP